MFENRRQYFDRMVDDNYDDDFENEQINSNFPKPSNEAYKSRNDRADHEDGRSGISTAAVTAEGMHGLYEIEKTTEDVLESAINSKEWFLECQRALPALSAPIS